MFGRVELFIIVIVIAILISVQLLSAMAKMSSLHVIL